MSLPVFPTHKAASLFAYLVTYRQRAHARDVLAGTLWSDLPDAQARRNLSTALWRVRRTLGHDYVLTGEESVAFNTQSDYWLDVAAFEEIVDEETGKQGDKETLSTCLPEFLSTAVDLYCGEFLEGFGDDWCLLERERLRALYLEALQGLVSSHTARGDYQAALRYALLLTRHDPLREQAHREVMRLQLSLGQRNAALQQYHLCCQLLQDELGQEPLPETVALYHEIQHRAEARPSPPPLFNALNRLPIVGRAKERCDLLAHVEATLSGQGRLVLVEGEAGVGKTRLMIEIAADAQWRGAAVLWGRGRDLDALPPYGPLVEAMEKGLTPLRASQLAGLAEETWLSQMSLLLPSLSRLIPNLQQPLYLSPEQEHSRLLEAICWYLRGLSRIAPHVIMLEDIHWADEQTLEALQVLTSGLSQMRLLVLCAFRAETVREKSWLWEALLALDKSPTCHRLSLNRLSETDTKELVRLALGQADPVPDFGQRMYQETDGNPLFVAETLKTLTEDGVLRWNEAGGWSVSEPAAISRALGVPQGISQMIDRRLSRLDADARTVLEMAAVLGEHFDLPWLAAACEWDGERLLASTGALVRRQWLQEREDGYAFHHDKTRQAVYAGLGPTRRRALHRRAGQALEKLAPDKVEELAWHFYRGELWTKAPTYCIKAGEKAQSLHANQEALEHYARALSFLPEGDEQAATALMRIGDICFLLADVENSLAAYRRALPIWERLGNQAMLAEVNYAIGRCYFSQGRIDEDVRYILRGLSYAEPAGLQRAIIKGLRMSARCFHLNGDLDAMQSSTARAMQLAEQVKDWHELGECHRLLGDLCLLQGDYSQALTHDFQAVALFSQVKGYEDRQIMLYNNIAEKYTLVGDAENALRYARHAMELAHKVGFVTGEGRLYLTISDVYIYLGQWDKAKAELEKVLALATRINNRQFQAICHAALGLIAKGEGNLSQATASLERAVEMTQVVAPQHVAAWSLQLANLCVELGDLKRAKALVTKGQALAQARKDRPIIGLSQRVLGRLESASARWERAARAFEASLAVFRAPENKLELARTCTDYGLLCLATGEVERGQHLLQNTLQDFIKLGAKADQARLEGILRGRKIQVRLAACDAPLGRPLQDEDKVSVIWIVDGGIEEAAMLARKGKVALRHWRLLRLLDEAKSQGGEPTVSDLAQALRVDERTIKRDLAALRAQGKPVATRHAKVSP